MLECSCRTSGRRGTRAGRSRWSRGRWSAPSSRVLYTSSGSSSGWPLQKRVLLLKPGHQKLSERRVAVLMLEKGKHTLYKTSPESDIVLENAGVEVYFLLCRGKQLWATCPHVDAIKQIAFMLRKSQKHPDVESSTFLNFVAELSRRSQDRKPSFRGL